MKLMTPVLPLILALFVGFSVTAAAETTNQWRSPEHVDGAITTSLQQAKNLFDEGVVFIDVRNIRLYTKKHIPGAHHLDLKDGFEEQALAAIVKQDQPVVIYCSGVKCSRSYKASAKAVSWGFTKVHYFRGGIVAWKNAGYPLKYADSPSAAK